MENSLESFIILQIRRIKAQQRRLKREDHSHQTYWTLFNRYAAQVDILNQCLTGHTNPLAVVMVQQEIQKQK